MTALFNKNSGAFFSAIAVAADMGWKMLDFASYSPFRELGETLVVQKFGIDDEHRCEFVAGLEEECHGVYVVPVADVNAMPLRRSWQKSIAAKTFKGKPLVRDQVPDPKATQIAGDGKAYDAITFKFNAVEAARAAGEEENYHIARAIGEQLYLQGFNPNEFYAANKMPLRVYPNRPLDPADEITIMPARFTGDIAQYLVFVEVK